MNRYVLHPAVYSDLFDIWEFIAKDNLEMADRVREEVYQAICFLAAHPRIGHRRPDITWQQHLRFSRVYEYLIAYAPEETPLLVLAIIHGRRSPRVMAKILRSRL